jgi:hypothetical protein
LLVGAGVVRNSRPVGIISPVLKAALIERLVEVYNHRFTAARIVLGMVLGYGGLGAGDEVWLIAAIKLS